MTTSDTVPDGFLPHTPEGRDGLAALLADPGRALIALDFDGTLSPVVPSLRWVSLIITSISVSSSRPFAYRDNNGFAPPRVKPNRLAPIPVPLNGR